MEDPEQAFDSFQSIFEKVLNRYAPITKINPSKKPHPPWFNNELKNLRSKRNKAHRNWKKNTENSILLNTFTNLRKKFEQAVKMNKRKFYWNKLKNCIGDSRQTYKLLNELNGKSISRFTVPILESCQKLNDNPTEKDVANRFNDFFINIGENLKTDIPNESPPPVPKLNWSMGLYRTTPSEINDIICQLDKKSTSGDDYISNQIVKDVTSTFPR